MIQCVLFNCRKKIPWVYLDSCFSRLIDVEKLKADLEIAKQKWSLVFNSISQLCRGPLCLTSSPGASDPSAERPWGNVSRKFSLATDAVPFSSSPSVLTALKWYFGSTSQIPTRKLEPEIPLPSISTYLLSGMSGGTYLYEARNPEYWTAESE